MINKIWQGMVGPLTLMTTKVWWAIDSFLNLDPHSILYSHIIFATEGVGEVVGCRPRWSRKMRVTVFPDESEMYLSVVDIDNAGMSELFLLKNAQSALVLWERASRLNKLRGKDEEVLY